jgi:glycosyltransferase involved in cell wall biosynthesis
MLILAPSEEIRNSSFLNMSYKFFVSMKICFVGNAESIHMQRWIKWFLQRGHITFLITPYWEKINDVQIYNLQRKKGFFNVFIRVIKTIQLIWRLKPDFVYGHYISGTETIAAAFSNYHPFFVTAWGSDLATDPEKSFFHKIIIKFVISRADIIQTGDEYGKQRLIELGCDEKKIFVLPWGTDFSDIKSKTNPLEKKNKYVILSPRTWHQKHNVDILIKAAPDVMKKIKDISFIFIGGGPLEEELRALSKTLGITQNIVLVGKVPHSEIYNYLINTDILVDTIPVGNAGGGIGMINMEAMSCGVPLLSAERDYLKKAGKSLQDEPWYCSLVYDGGNPKDLAEKIIQLLKDEELRKEIGQKEKEIAREIGDWNKNMSKLEHLMLDML